jgi:hypothetical protein
MSEQELIRAMQELIARQSPPAEPHRLMSELISRDRARVGLLAGFIILLWLGGIGGVLYMIFWLNRFIILYSPTDTDGLVGWRDVMFHTKMELHHSLEACMAAVPALLLAALGTVWLVFSSRRTTLNQINLSLAVISDQLRQMGSPTRPAGGDRDH